MIFLVLCVIFITVIGWQMIRDNKIKRHEEAIQEPSLNTDADWTLLDELAIDISRHESLARWYAQGRQIFRDAPLKDVNVEGGWEVFCDEFGEDIPENYERIFQEIRGLKPRERARRLRAAEKLSVSARGAYNAKPIILPDQSTFSFPAWMQMPRRTA